MAIEASLVRRMALVGGGVAAATVTLDQGTKAYVRAHLREDEFHSVAGQEWLGVEHVRNEGSSYGMLGRASALLPAVLTLALGGSMALAAPRQAKPILAAAGAGLIFGGGIGNGIDRATGDRKVTDFLHATDLFAYFNVADMGLAAGLGAFALAVR